MNLALEHNRSSRTVGTNISRACAEMLKGSPSRLASRSPTTAGIPRNCACTHSGLHFATIGVTADAVQAVRSVPRRERMCPSKNAALTPRSEMALMKGSSLFDGGIVRRHSRARRTFACNSDEIQVSQCFAGQHATTATANPRLSSSARSFRMKDSERQGYLSTTMRTRPLTIRSRLLSSAISG